MASTLINLAKVIEVGDPKDGNCVRVKMTAKDSNENKKNLSWAFPLLPKMFTTLPKKGELVIILTTDIESEDSRKYYIGPIISQPQALLECEADEAKSFINNLDDNTKAPKRTPISKDVNLTGCFPDKDEVSILGRKNSDIILSDNDLRIRCGVKIVDTYGNISFNKESPAFIKLAYHPSGIMGAKSTATIVADDINLLSNIPAGEYNLNSTDKQITDDDMAKIISNAHVLPYGDLLIEFLDVFRTAFINHTHPWPTMPPCPTDTVLEIQNQDLGEMISKHVRIN